MSRRLIKNRYDTHEHAEHSGKDKHQDHTRARTRADEPAKSSRKHPLRLLLQARAPSR
jgi:hypothetical protein